MLNVKDAIKTAIDIHWPSFAARHPRLAEAIDQTLLTEQIVEDLSADVEYQQTLAHADALGTTADVVLSLIDRYVRGWLRGLTGS